MAIDIFATVSKFTDGLKKLFAEHGVESATPSKENLISWIREEVDELKEAQSEFNIVKEVDALIDMLYFLLDYCARTGFVPQKASDRVFFDSSDVISISELHILVNHRIDKMIGDDFDVTPDDIMYLLDLFMSCLRSFGYDHTTIERIFMAVHDSNVRKMIGGTVDVERKKLIKPKDHVAPDGDIYKIIIEWNLTQAALIFHRKHKGTTADFGAEI